MLYTTVTIKKKEYKLRLNAKACVELEKKLGKNPLNIFMTTNGGMPLFTDLIAVFQAALAEYQHGIGNDEALALFDDYCEDGGDIAKFTTLIMDIFKEGGFFPKEIDGEEEKN